MVGNVEEKNGSSWHKDSYVAQSAIDNKSIIDARGVAYLLGAAITIGGVGAAVHEISNRRLGVIISNDEFSKGVSVWWMHSGCGVGISRPLRIVSPQNQPPQGDWKPIAKCIFN